MKKFLGAAGFRTETAVIAIACLSVVALAVVLVRDAVSRTEATLSSAAKQEVAQAAGELKEQYEERAAYGGTSIAQLPLAAQNVSLRGLSDAVLRSYVDVRGGFYFDKSQQVVGAAGELASEDADTLQSAVAEVRRTGRPVTLVSARGQDLLVMSAAPVGENTSAWALKRLAGVHDPVSEQRRVLIAALTISALASVLAVVSISIRLRRGVDLIKHNLKQLETDFSFRPAPRSDDFGEINAAIATMADKRMQLESTLRRQDRLAALGKVVAAVAHEIRNPLNSIGLNLELLKRKTQKGVASTAEVTAAMHEVERLNTMLGQLLGFGKPDLSNRRVQAILPLVKRSLDLVHDRSMAKRVTVQVEPGSADAVADVDGFQFEQVLINLLLNAIDVSPEQGSVSVAIAEQGGFVEVMVKDQGPGIPAQVREHVFDAFFTTKADGTGLGLSVSREIAGRHGGELDFVTSNAGTTFAVRVPVDRSSN